MFALNIALAVTVTVTATATAPPAAVHATATPVLPFIADDYEKALAEARARRVPLFIESWAPW